MNQLFSHFRYCFSLFHRDLAHPWKTSDTEKISVAVGKHTSMDMVRQAAAAGFCRTLSAAELRGRDTYIGLMRYNPFMLEEVMK